MFGSLHFERRRAGPDDLECKFAPDEQFGMARDMDSQSICTFTASFREAFFLQLQAPVGFVKRHTELVRSRGKRVLEMHRVALFLRRQVCREE